MLAVVLLVAACGGDPAPARTSPAATPNTASTPTTVAPRTVPETAVTTTLPLVEPPTGLCDAYGEPVAVGAVADDRLVEVSGIARSRGQRGVTWMHNDSGGGTVVYAVDEGGQTIAAYNLGVLTLDPEDLAIGRHAGADHLYLADVGDNLALRPVVSLYRVPEPVLAEGDMGQVERIDLILPDGPVDIEAVAIDPLSGDVVVVTKVASGPSTVLVGGAQWLVDGGAVRLEPIASLDLGGAVTALDFGPLGDRVVMRGYDDLWLWPRADFDLALVFAEPPCPLPAPPEPQGEAVAVDLEGKVVTVSEGEHPTVFELTPESP